MEFHESAFKHGITEEEISHAVRLALLSYEVDDDHPRRFLHLGPDTANNILEIVTLEFDDGRSLVIHAMKMRPKYADLLLKHFGEAEHDD